MRRREARARRAQEQRRQKARAIARRVARFLRDEYGASRVVLFGSMAREGRLGPRSVWADAEPDASDYRVDAVALNLHGFYAGLERIFETIATRVDRTVPEGRHWHQDLLDQMNTELSGVRPAVLSDQTREKLVRYRGFRHVVRNVYAFEFDPEQIGLLMKRLPEAKERVFEDLRSFADLLEQMARPDE